MKNSRNYNIDLIKLLACGGVVLEHASVKMYFDGHLISTILYNMGMASVPLFLMCSGFFMLHKKYSYWDIHRKVLKIVFLVFFWGGSYFLLTIPFKDISMLRFLDNSFGPLVQRGYFSQLWFLGALIILYELQPILIWLKKYPNFYYLFFGILMFLSMIININSMFDGHYIASNIPQTFRVWSWIGYYILGDIAYTLQIKRVNFPKYFSWISFVLILIYSYLIEFCEGISKNEYVYDSLFIHVMILIIFMTLLNCKLSIRRIIFIKHGIPYTMGIYLFQQTFRRIYYSCFSLKNIWDQLFIVIFMLLGSIAVTWIINKSILRKVNQI